MTKRALNLTALFFLMLGFVCMIGVVQMFREKNPDPWFCLAGGMFALLAAGVIRFAASQMAASSVMTFKRTLFFATVGGLLLGATMSGVTTLLGPDSPLSIGFEAIHFPLSPLHAWLPHVFDSTVDVENIYLFALPVYWAVIGFLIGLIYWMIFGKRKAHHAA